MEKSVLCHQLRCQQLKYQKLMGNIQFYLSDTRIVLQCTVQNVLKEALTELNPSRVAVALVLKKYTLPSHYLLLKTLLPATHPVCCDEGAAETFFLVADHASSTWHSDLLIHCQSPNISASVHWGRQVHEP